ncbi:MAG: STAS domain-containing protein [Gammaproteobacteria bacterium]|nr:STAS domain-containing protein [Gammaproteobacteria bacterium]MCW8986286.1 STAS domain-containing protein [Gammaproteobacteria bacterium]MCW9030246.1 STAS domain-containing protein [Gammaproteobacteria bacterium]
MSVETRLSNDGVYTISIKGDFNFLLLNEFRDAYSSKESLSAKKHIVDLAKTETIDSSALGMLLNMQRHLEKGDCEINIINCNAVVQKIFNITHFGKKFNIE